MQGRGLIIFIVLIFVHLYIFGFNLGQSADNETSVVDPVNFVSTMERGVAAIATKAQENYSERCALAQNCTCSRTECYPRKHAKDSPGLNCVYFNNNTACSTKTKSSCNKVWADLREGYVRVPPRLNSNLISNLNSSIDKVVRKTVCAQKNLDSTFIAVHENITKAFNLSTFYTVYFGAVDGSFRFFPGREMSPYNCSTFDPRTRPWYRGATSVVKHLVVLLDTGSHMRQNLPDLIRPDTSSPLKLAVSMTDSILKTLTKTDRATVIPFNESADAPTFPGSMNWSVPSLDTENAEWPESVAEEVEEFLHSVDLPYNDPSTKASNFTAGFLKALSILNSSDLTEPLKIVILITEENDQYGLPSEQDQQTALQFQKQGIRLFVYEIKRAGNTKDWARVCCNIDGYNQKLDQTDVFTDPMSSLTSYVTFLARSRIAANNQIIKPYWQDNYVAASGLGDVVTVTNLVMSTDGRQLIGVVGIDIQTAGLVDTDFIKQVNDYLIAKASMTISSYQNGTDFPNCNFSENVYGDPNLSACNASNRALCIEKDEFEPLTDATKISLVCCDDCAITKRSWWDKHKIMILSISLTVIPGTVLIFMLSTFTIRNVGSWLPRQEVNRPPPAQLYSFQDMCEATNDFDNANIIDTDEFGVLYKARFTDENLVAIKWLGQSADHIDDSQADIQTLNIDGHSSLVKLKGTGFGPANEERLRGSNFGPTDRFLVYTMVEDGNGHVESEYGIWL